MFPDVFWLKPWCVGRCYAVYYAVGRSTFAMDRSLSALFPPALCPDWFQFDEYDYCYVPHQGLASSLVCCLYRRPTAEELVTNPHHKRALFEPLSSQALRRAQSHQRPHKRSSR